MNKTKRGDSELTTAVSASISSEEDEQDEETESARVEGSSINDESQSSDEVEEKRRKRHRIRRIVIGVCLAAVIIFVIVDSTTTKYCRSAIESLLQWVEENPAAGIIAFTLFVFVATVAFIPGAILTIGAGFVFERAWRNLGIALLVGTLTVFVGASLGAIVSFLIGRYLLRDCVDRLAHRYSIFEALDSVLAQRGFRIMVLLRLSPIIPFNAINYISGVTSISLMAYSLANIAIIPGTLLFVFVGASAGCITNNMGSGATVTIISFVIGAVFAVFAIFLTSFYARRELNRIIASRETRAEDDAIRESDVEPALADSTPHQEFSSSDDQVFYSS